MPMEPKFEIGQKVKFINDPDNHAGKVLSFSFNGSVFSYTISSRVYDQEAHDMVEGVKNCKEDELVAVEETEE